MAGGGNCSFYSICSLEVCSNVDTFCSLSSLPSSLSSVLLTESGFFFGTLTNSFDICQNHLTSIQEKNRLRRKGKCCGIPHFIASHTIKNKRRPGKQKADRHLNVLQVEDIYRKYGTVLPVGTRKYLYIILNFGK